MRSAPAGWIRRRSPPGGPATGRRPDRKTGAAGEGRGRRLPPLPLLTVAQAAAGWMEAGICARPAPQVALFAAVALLARTGPVRAVFAPVWAAYPAVGFGDRDALPTPDRRRHRLVGWERPVTWPVAFLHLVAESARAGLRELERARSRGRKGRAVIAGCDERSRLPDAVDALLHTAALTPKALAARVKIASQTGTALLRELQVKGVAREITGRGSFRAFAV